MGRFARLASILSLALALGGCGQEVSSSGKGCKSDYDCPGIETICQDEQCVNPNGEIFCYDDFDCPSEEVCEENVCSSDGTASNSGVLSPNTKILTEAGINKLYDVSASTLSFQSSSAYAQDLHAGDIVVTGVHEITPSGLLRKVTSVENQGRGIQVYTEMASLEQALVQANFNGTVDFSNGVETKSAPLKGDGLETKKGALSVYSVSVEFNDTDLYNGILFLDGSIGATLDSNLQIEIDWNTIERVSYTITGEEGLDLTVSGEFAQSLDKELPAIEPIQFAPITFFLPTVPPFPIVITPNLTVTLGIKASGQMSAQTSVSQSLELEVGLEYQNGQWTDIRGVTNAFNFNPPSLGETSGSLEVFAKPRFSLELYDIVGPHTEVRGHLRGETGFDNNFWYKLFAGVQVGVGVKVDAFGKSLVDYSKIVWVFEKLLASSDPVVEPSCESYKACDDIGERLCNPAVEALLCEYNADNGCIEWTVDNCWAKEMDCIDGYCKPKGTECSDDCDYSGQTICSGSDSMKTCGDYDSDDCLDWKVTECTSESTCQDGSCNGGGDTRFVVQNNGSVLDTQTGVYWKTVAFTTMQWQEAKAYCENFSGGWEMPTFSEMSQLTSDSTTGCKLPAVINGVNCTNNTFYWTRSVACNDTTTPIKAFDMYFPDSSSTCTSMNAILPTLCKKK